MNLQDVLTAPTLDTWWQFLVCIVIITAVLWFLFQKIFVICLSEKLHPKPARKIGAMAAFTLVILAIVIDLSIYFLNHFSQQKLWFYDYLTPIAICLVLIVLFFITRSQLKIENK